MTETHKPWVQKYLAVKSLYPHTLLLFRMGDFYELFYDDARKAAKLLNLTLTSRGESAGSPVVMAGVSYLALDSAAHALRAAGESAVVIDLESVAIIEALPLAIGDRVSVVGSFADVTAKHAGRSGAVVDGPKVLFGRKCLRVCLEHHGRRLAVVVWLPVTRLRRAAACPFRGAQS